VIQAFIVLMKAVNPQALRPKLVQQLDTPQPEMHCCDYANMTIVMNSNKYTVSKSGFKSRALEYFRQVEKSRKPVIITDRGKPVLKVVPFSEDPEEILRELRGSALKFKDPVKPVAESDWEVLR
jgi:prevent-host-death family protein